MRAIKDETIFYGLLYVLERGEGNILPSIFYLSFIIYAGYSMNFMFHI